MTAYEARYADPPHSRDSHRARDPRSRRASTGAPARHPRRFAPPDFRPSRADKEQRKARHDLEKETGYDWTDAVLLGVMGLTTILSFDKALEKQQQKSDEREAEGRRNRQRRKREGDDGGSRGASEGTASTRRYRNAEDFDRTRSRHSDDRDSADDDDGYYRRDSRRRGRSRERNYDRDLDEGYPRGRSVEYERYRGARRQETW